MYCVTPRRLKNSTACAPQPVTSRASCSSTRTVPLRRRREMVLATSPRGLAIWSAAVDRLIADQVADIGNDPVGAGLDEQIVVELVEIVLHDRELLADKRQKRQQRAAGLGGQAVELDLLVLAQRRGAACRL